MNERTTGAAPPPYPTGDVIANCICGSWPGGKCLRCPYLGSAQWVRDRIDKAKLRAVDAYLKTTKEPK